MSFVLFDSKVNDFFKKKNSILFQIILQKHKHAHPSRKHAEQHNYTNKTCQKGVLPWTPTTKFRTPIVDRIAH